MVKSTTPTEATLFTNSGKFLSISLAFLQEATSIGWPSHCTKNCIAAQLPCVLSFLSSMAIGCLTISALNLVSNLGYEAYRQYNLEGFQLSTCICCQL